MTYECYLNQPKSMLEWKLIEKLDKNPKLIRVSNHQYSSHPLLREYCHIDRDEFYV